MAVIEGDHEVEVSRLKAQRAKTINLKLIDEDEIEQYVRLHNNKLELLKTNPGSIIIFELDEGKFKSIYLHFTALKSGLKAICRQLISVNRTWLNGLFGVSCLLLLRLMPTIAFT